MTAKILPLAILMTLILTLPNAWSVTFNYASGFGAGTTVQAVAGTGSYDIPFIQIGPRDSGGEGALYASDRATALSTGSSGTASSVADAVLGELGGFVEVIWSIPLSGFPEGSSGMALAVFYDTFTVVSDTLADGSPVSIILPWTLTGSFSRQTPGENAGIASFSISIYDAYPICCQLLTHSVTSGSSGYTSVNLFGTLDISAAFQNYMPLTVGDSFIVYGYLRVQAGPPGGGWSLPTTFTADFSSTASLRPVSNTPGVSLTSHAQQAAPPPTPVPEFGLSSVLMASVAATVYFLRSLPCRIRPKG